MDFASRFLGGYGQGRADKQQADALAKQEKINALLGQAYADPSQRDTSLAQAAPLDFGAVVQAEQAFGSRDDRVNKGRANLSRTFLAMPPEGRARFAQQFGQDFQRLGLDPNAPDFEQIATGYAAMAGTGSELPSEIRTLEYLKAHPELMGINDQLRGTESFQKIINADGTVSYVALNNRTGTGAIAPVGGPGQPAQPQQPYAPPQPQPSPGLQMDSAEQVILKIEEQDGPLPPDVRQKLAAQLRGGGAFDVSNPSAAPQPAVNRQPTLDQIPYGQYGGGPVGGSGLGESNADRARAAANQSGMTEAAKIAAQQDAAPRQAELDARRESLVVTARETAESQAVKAAALPQVIIKADQTLALIAKALNHPGRTIATGGTGAMGLGLIPGTDGRDFMAVLKQLKGQAFLEAFQSLKGGGAITQVEGTKAEEAIARLDIAQSDEEFAAALNDLAAVAESAKARALELAQGGQPQAPQGASTGWGMQKL